MDIKFFRWRIWYMKMKKDYISKDIKSLSQNYPPINNKAIGQLYKTKVVLLFLFISCKQFPESVMPRICSLNHPSSCWMFLDEFLFLSSVSYMWYVSPFDNFLFYFFGMVCFVKA